MNVQARIDDKTYLARTYGQTIGRAKVTGYCVRFRALEDVDIDVLESALRDGFVAGDENG